MGEYTFVNHVEKSFNDYVLVVSGGILSSLVERSIKKIKY
jgi:hypothetical protein